MEKLDLDSFLEKFKFKKEMEGFIGIERERFLLGKNGKLVPRSNGFLKVINNGKWTHELSACQVEDRTVPQKELEHIRRELIKNDRAGKETAGQLGLELISLEVAPADMPLDVYPDPRYLRIKKTITKDKLIAACRVTGTHIHLGMPDIETAIETANKMRDYLDSFCKLGNNSNGERLRLYKVMASDWKPPFYNSVNHFFETAKKGGFLENPRNCWHLIRISIHGTVELRMFGK